MATSKRTPGVPIKLPTRLTSYTAPTAPQGPTTRQTNLSVNRYNVPSVVATTLSKPQAITQGMLKEPRGESINWANRLGTVADKLAPYASNIANMASSPARPVMGETVSSRKLTAPNFDEARYDVMSSEQAMARNADQSLDGVTAASVKLGARAQTLGSLNKLASAEANAKIETGNRQASMDMYADQINAQTRNQYTNDMTTFANTAKSATLANVSNAADKYVAQKNVKAQGDLDLKKAAIMSAMWDKGLTERTLGKVDDIWTGMGTTVFGDGKKKLKAGGMITRINNTTAKLANYK